MVAVEESLDVGIHHVAAEANRLDIVRQDRDCSAIVLHEHGGCSPPVSASSPMEPVPAKRSRTRLPRTRW